MAVDSQTGRAFLATSDRLIMLDTRTMMVLHMLAMQVGPMVVDHQDGRIFAGDLSGKTIWVLNGRSGHIVQTIPLHRYWGSPSAVDEPASSIFVVPAPDYHGNTPIDNLVILDAHSGYSLRSSEAGAGLTDIAVDTHTGHVLLALQGPIDSQWMPTGMGIVRVLDGRSGSVLATIPVGRGPSSVAIDEHSDHAFVSNIYSSDVTMVDLSQI